MAKKKDPKRSAIGRRSRNKGKVGERELVHFLRDRNHPANRGQQFDGSSGDEDVTHSLNGIHLECKRVEQGSLYDWLKQATEDARPGKMPVVAHRKNNQEWVAIMRFEDFLKLVHDPIATLCEDL